MAVSDTRTASLVLVAGAAGVAYWYWHLTKGALASPAAAAPPSDQGIPQTRVSGDSPLARLEAFAGRWGLPVTSTTGGRHVPGSLHYVGRAIDTGLPNAADLPRIISDAIANGFRVLVENYRGQGRYGYSSGPHLHIEVPR